MKFISNAFSINMVESPAVGGSFEAVFHRVSSYEASQLVAEDHYKSVIGHQDMAEVLGIQQKAASIRYVRAIRRLIRRSCAVLSPPTAFRTMDGRSRPTPSSR